MLSLNPVSGSKMLPASRSARWDCIHSDDDSEMFFINPDDCIDCAYCESACPVSAIFDEFTVPAQYREYVQKNRAYFRK